MLAFLPFISSQMRCQKQLSERTCLQSHPDECFIHRFDLFGRGLLGRRCLFIYRLTSSDASASHLSLGKPPMSKPVGESTSGSVRSRARNDLRHVTAEKIYTSLMLLLQAGVIKVELAISLVMEAKQPVESNWNFERCRCSLWGRFTGDRLGS